MLEAWPSVETLSTTIPLVPPDSGSSADSVGENGWSGICSGQVKGHEASARRFWVKVGLAWNALGLYAEEEQVDRRTQSPASGIVDFCYRRALVVIASRD